MQHLLEFAYIIEELSGFFCYLFLERVASPFLLLIIYFLKGSPALFCYLLPCFACQPVLNSIIESIYSLSLFL